MTEAPRFLKSFFIFSILSALFILSQFYRVSNAVIAPNLIQDLSLNAETLGILGGAFFYSFALFQIPMGPMLDRIGPRFVVTFFRYGTFIGLQGLWLGPYLMDIKGYSPVQTGNLLTFLAIGMILGGPVGGRLSDQTFRSRKGVALWGFSLYSLSLFPLIGVLKIQNPFWFSLIFFFIGFFSGFGMVVYSHAKELFPIAISGTVMTWVNFFTMVRGED